MAKITMVASFPCEYFCGSKDSFGAPRSPWEVLGLRDYLRIFGRISVVRRIPLEPLGALRIHLEPLDVPSCRWKYLGLPGSI